VHIFKRPGVMLSYVAKYSSASEKEVTEHMDWTKWQVIFSQNTIQAYPSVPLFQIVKIAWSESTQKSTRTSYLSDWIKYLCFSRVYLAKLFFHQVSYQSKYKNVFPPHHVYLGENMINHHYWKRQTFYSS